MVDIIGPVYRALPRTSGTQKVHASPTVAPYTEDKAPEPYTMSKDRRKGRDRRRRCDARPIYDHRSGRGRRKEDRPPSIEVKI